MSSAAEVHPDPCPVTSAARAAALHAAQGRPASPCSHSTSRMNTTRPVPQTLDPCALTPDQGPAAADEGLAVIKEALQSGVLQQLAAGLVPALDDCDALTRELLVWALHLLLMNLLECNVVRCACCGSWWA